MTSSSSSLISARTENTSDNSELEHKNLNLNNNNSTNENNNNNIIENNKNNNINNSNNNNENAPTPSPSFADLYTIRNPYTSPSSVYISATASTTSLIYSLDLAAENNNTNCSPNSSIYYNPAFEHNSTLESGVDPSRIDYSFSSPRSTATTNKGSLTSINNNSKDEVCSLSTLTRPRSQATNKRSSVDSFYLYYTPTSGNINPSIYLKSAPSLPPLPKFSISPISSPFSNSHNHNHNHHQQVDINSAVVTTDQQNQTKTEEMLFDSLVPKSLKSFKSGLRSSSQDDSPISTTYEDAAMYGDDDEGIVLTSPNCNKAIIAKKKLQQYSTSPHQFESPREKVFYNECNQEWVSSSSSPSPFYLHENKMVNINNNGNSPVVVLHRTPSAATTRRRMSQPNIEKYRTRQEIKEALELQIEQENIMMKRQGSNGSNGLKRLSNGSEYSCNYSYNGGAILMSRNNSSRSHDDLQSLYYSSLDSDYDGETTVTTSNGPAVQNAVVGIAIDHDIRGATSTSQSIDKSEVSSYGWNADAVAINSGTVAEQSKNSKQTKNFSNLQNSFFTFANHNNKDRPLQQQQKHQQSNYRASENFHPYSSLAKSNDEPLPSEIVTRPTSMYLPAMATSVLGGENNIHSEQIHHHHHHNQQNVLYNSKQTYGDQIHLSPSKSSKLDSALSNLSTSSSTSTNSSSSHAIPEFSNININTNINNSSSYSKSRNSTPSLTTSSTGPSESSSPSSVSSKRLSGNSPDLDYQEEDTFPNQSSNSNYMTSSVSSPHVSRPRSSSACSSNSSHFFNSCADRTSWVPTSLASPTQSSIYNLTTGNNTITPSSPSCISNTNTTTTSNNNNEPSTRPASSSSAYAQAILLSSPSKPPAIPPRSANRKLHENRIKSIIYQNSPAQSPVSHAKDSVAGSGFQPVHSTNNSSCSSSINGSCSISGRPDAGRCSSSIVIHTNNPNRAHRLENISAASSSSFYNSSSFSSKNSISTTTSTSSSNSSNSSSSNNSISPLHITKKRPSLSRSSSLSSLSSKINIAASIVNPVTGQINRQAASVYIDSHPHQSSTKHIPFNTHTTIDRPCSSSSSNNNNHRNSSRFTKDNILNRLNFSKMQHQQTSPNSFHDEGINYSTPSTPRTGNKQQALDNTPSSSYSTSSYGTPLANATSNGSIAAKSHVSTSSAVPSTSSSSQLFTSSSIIHPYSLNPSDQYNIGTAAAALSRVTQNTSSSASTIPSTSLTNNTSDITIGTDHDDFSSNTDLRKERPTSTGSMDDVLKSFISEDLALLDSLDSSLDTLALGGSPLASPTTPRYSQTSPVSAASALHSGGTVHSPAVTISGSITPNNKRLFSSSSTKSKGMFFKKKFFFPLYFLLYQ